jgi:hypothetical protein
MFVVWVEHSQSQKRMSMVFEKGELGEGKRVGSEVAITDMPNTGILLSLWFIFAGMGFSPTAVLIPDVFIRILVL